MLSVWELTKAYGGLDSVITVREVLHAADAITQVTYRPLEAYLVVCVLFIAVVLPLSSFVRRMERSTTFVRRG